jgi:pilus assembly protein Flp/PilA
MSMRKIIQLGRDTRGANMVEYIILVGVIAILALGAFKKFGTKINDKINSDTGTVDTEVNTTSATTP